MNDHDLEQGMAEVFGGREGELTAMALTGGMMRALLAGTIRHDDRAIFYASAAVTVLQRLKQRQRVRCHLCDDRLASADDLGAIVCIARETEDAFVGVSSAVCVACCRQAGSPDDVSDAVVADYASEYGIDMRLVRPHPAGPGHA